jgi:acyl-CoA thioesterase
VRFADASAVSGGDGRWQGHFQQGWDIFGITNGGYALSLATRSMEGDAEGRSLVSVSATYVNPSTPGPVDISVETLKRGRNMTTLRAAVTRDETSVFYATGVFAGADRPIPDRDILTGDPPDLPPPEECVRAEPTEGASYPPEFHGHVDVRLHPADAAAFLGDYAPVPSFRGWFRLLDEEPLSSHAIVMATDAFPPAIFNSRFAPGWTPTVELSVQIRTGQPSGWLAGQFTTRFVTGGVLEEDGELWDETGRLVALSRQLALVPRRGAT